MSWGDNSPWSYYRVPGRGGLRQGRTGSSRGGWALAGEAGRRLGCEFAFVVEQ